MLRAADVRFSYGAATVLHEVSLSVRRGTVVGLLGPNGSGKTTLLRVLAGTLTPAAGYVVLGGAAITTLSRRDIAMQIAVVPQETHLAFDYSVLDMALMGRYPHLGAFELESPDDEAIAREALAATGTEHLEARSFMTLSGGEKQRVIIASALTQFGHVGTEDAPATPGRFLLLDEPTASLDLHYQLDIAALLQRLAQQHALGIVVSTHDLNLAAAVCDELVLLRDGRVVATGRTRDVLTAATIRRLYDVECDVRLHAEAGHLTVVPLRTASPSSEPTT